MRVVVIRLGFYGELATSWGQGYLSLKAKLLLLFALSLYRGLWYLLEP